MRFTLGTGDAGDIVCLDVLPESPHGIIVTGPGPNGALFARSLIQSTADAHSPEALRMWLVRPDSIDPSALEKQFAFLRHQLPTSDLTLLREEVDAVTEIFHRDTLLSALPHVDHMITATDSAATFADLTDTELQRRLDLLRAAGAADWTQYRLLRSRGQAHLEPLPRLLIQVDGFLSLLTSGEPRIAGVLQRISSVGRCTGIAMQLCSSTLDGGTWPSMFVLLSNMSYTITMGDADQTSLQILRRPRPQLDAATEPGQAVLHYGDDFISFTTT